jgi:hypothetical protein
MHLSLHNSGSNAKSRTANHARKYRIEKTVSNGDRPQGSQLSLLNLGSLYGSSRMPEVVVDLFH